MSKGPRQYVVKKVIRMTVAQAKLLRAIALRWQCSESEAVRKFLVVAKGAK